jgi:hypothetical protein
MPRITRRDLESVVARLNREAYTGFPSTRPFELSGAYGGFALHRQGSDVLRSGHVPARQLYDMIHAFLEGMELGRNLETIATR